MKVKNATTPLGRTLATVCFINFLNVFVMHFYVYMSIYNAILMKSSINSCCNNYVLHHVHLSEFYWGEEDGEKKDAPKEEL